MSKLVFNPLSGNFDVVYDQATEIKYAPSTTTDWAGTLPTNVLEALDNLANRTELFASLINPQAIYVDAIGGDNTFGTGGILAPVQSIPTALTFVTDPSKYYILHLAPGDYSGGALTIPGNVSIQGNEANVTHDVTITFDVGSIAFPRYNGVGFGNITMDLTPAAVALPVFQNGGFSITRLDATTGPHYIQIFDGNLNALDLTGTASVSNVLFTGSCDVKNNGALILNGCVIGIPVSAEEMATISMVGCTFSGSITGITVGLDTSIVRSDSTSLSFGGVITGCEIQYLDVANTVGYTPSTPADWETIPDDVAEGLDLLKSFIRNNQQLTKEPTGFASRTTSSISFDELNREFTIAPTGASFDVYVKGVKFTKTSETIPIPDSSGDHYIYYSSAGVLSSTMVINESLFADNALVAIIYWNADTSKQSYFGEERHGLVMDGATHGYLHTVFGARYISGCALQGFTIGAGSVDADAQFSADSGSIRDEDILHQFSSQAQLPVLYRVGANWRKKAADAFPFIQSGSAGYVGANGRIAYNQFTGGAWQLTEIPNNHFTMVHVFATNDINNPYVAIIGTNTYATKPDAQDSANSEIASLTGIPFAEFVAVGTVILQSSNSFTNSVKAAVQVTSDGANYVDFRGAQIFAPSGQASNHSLLSNLDKDDHIQYYNEARGDARYAITASNLGAGEDVFAQKTGTTLEFKSLVAGTNVTLTSDANTITIQSADTGEVNTASNVGAGAGVFKTKSGQDLQFKSLLAGSNISLSAGTNEVTISSPNISVVSKTATYTAAISDDVILCDGTFTVSLYAASTAVRQVSIKNIGFGIITIDANGSETIDGNLTYDLTHQWDSISLVSNGTGWFIL